MAAMSFCDFGSSSAYAARPFIVADGINRTQFYPIGTGPFGRSQPFLLSEGGERLFVITGTGNATKNNYTFRLLMFEMAEVTKYLRGNQKDAPAPVTVVTVDYDQSIPWVPFYDSAGIRELTLINGGNDILFIAPDEKNVHQIFKVNLRNRQKEQVTNSRTHVYQYGYNAETNSVFFLTGDLFKSKHCDELEYSLDQLTFEDTYCLPGGKTMSDIIFGLQPYSSPARIQFQKLQRGAEPVLLTSGVTLVSPLKHAVFSPDGKRAVLQVIIPEPPEELREKFESSERYLRASANPPIYYNKNVMPSFIEYTYYLLIDLARGSATHLADLVVPPPDRTGSTVVPMSQATWIDNEHVYLENVTDLGNQISADQLAGHAPAAATSGIIIHYPTLRRVSAAATGHAALGALESGRTIPSNQTKIYGSMPPTGRAGRQGRCSFTTRPTKIPNDNLPGCYLQDNVLGLRILTGEAFNRPPNLYIMDLETGREVMLMELNPQYKSVTFGEIEKVEWQDETGRTWMGGLVLPPDFQEGRRYPLVVQTHGFDPNSFLINGPYYGNAPYAAQALANRGMVVLQMADPVLANHMLLHGSQAVYARGVYSGIRLLDGRGIIDPTNVGVIGYSSNGPFVFNMTVFPEMPLKAIIVADAISPSPFSYVTTYQLPYQGMATHEIMACGATPWGATQSEWINRNPFYHLDKIQTPVLLEKYGPFATDWWDIFVGMKRLDKPVDFRVYSSPKHPPTVPAVIIKSQTLTVDWMDFWLNGREEPDASKQGQYALWRDMRSRVGSGQKLVTIAATPLSKMDCNFAIGASDSD